jgi:hypothetical protein
MTTKQMIIKRQLLEVISGKYWLGITRSRNYFTTDCQSVSMSWYRALLWDTRPDSISFRNVTVWNLRSCIHGASSLTRRRVWNLLCIHSTVRVAQNPKLYSIVSCETPPTWRARFPYLQGGPDSIRQFLIINNQSIQQHTGKWESIFCCR